jgi:hypothetical protein
MRRPDDADQSGKVRIRVLDSDPVIQQFFFTYAPKKISKADVYRTVRNADPDVDAGDVVRCCAGIAPLYGTGARADARIWTSVPDPCLTLQTAYRTI